MLNVSLYPATYRLNRCKGQTAEFALSPPLFNVLTSASTVLKNDDLHCRGDCHAALLIIHAPNEQVHKFPCVKHTCLHMLHNKLHKTSTLCYKTELTGLKQHIISAADQRIGVRARQFFVTDFRPMPHAAFHITGNDDSFLKDTAAEA